MINLALNPFKKGKKAEVEKVQKVHIEQDLELEETLRQYLNIPTRFNHTDMAIVHLRSMDKIVLPPEKIYSLLNYIVSGSLYRGSVDNKSDVTGCYLSKLIQHSFDADKNYNDYVLNTEDSKINSLFVALEGYKKNRIKATVNGSIGNNCLYGVTGCNITIHGDVGYACGNMMVRSRIKIDGDVGGGFGHGCHNSSFFIGGSIDDEFVRYAKNCTYSTSNEETYKKILLGISSKNKVRLLGPDGKVLEEKIK